VSQLEKPVYPTFSKLLLGKIWLAMKIVQMFRLLMGFTSFNARKINTTFTIAAASLFGRQAVNYHTGHVKNGPDKKK
jgi:hypothetical protein